ncbi:Uncharacterised protein g3534 [Pycnogonum litorale]
MAAALNKAVSYLRITNMKMRNINSSLNQTRKIVTTENGALLEEPKKISLGLSKVALTVIPGLYLGATISKEGAAFLEENDIFVPDDDDD